MSEVVSDRPGSLVEPVPGFPVPSRPGTRSSGGDGVLSRVRPVTGRYTRWGGGCLGDGGAEWGTRGVEERLSVPVYRVDHLRQSL